MRPLAGNAPARTHGGPFWSDRCFLAIAGVSLALKLTLAVAATGSPAVLDEKTYLGLAERLAAGEGWTSNFRPPLYPAVLAGLLALGSDLGMLRCLQALLATLCLVPVWAMARAVGGHRVASVAVGIVAFDPVLNGFSHLFWTETLYLALWLPGLTLLLSDPRGARPVRWLGAGLLLGLASLTRTRVLTFAPLLVLWAWLEARSGSGSGFPLRRWQGAAALALGWCLVVLPWAGRNVLATDGWFLVDTNGAYNVLLATDPRARYVDKDDAWSDAWGSLGGEAYVRAAARAPGESQRRALSLAGQRIAADPAGFVGKSLWEATHLLTLDDFVGRHLRNGWYGPHAPAWLPPTYAVVAALFTGLLLLIGGLGLVALPPSPFRRLAVLAVLHSVVLFGLAFSLSRHAVPLRPLLAVAAAWLTCQPVAAQRRLAGGRWRATAAVMVLLALLTAWSRDLPLLADMVTTGGASHRFRTIR